MAQKTFNIVLNAELLTPPVINLLSELEQRGYLQNGKIVFDDSNEREIQEIFDKYFTARDL